HALSLGLAELRHRQNGDNKCDFLEHGPPPFLEFSLFHSTRITHTAVGDISVIPCRGVAGPARRGFLLGVRLESLTLNFVGTFSRDMKSNLQPRWHKPLHTLQRGSRHG